MLNTHLDHIGKVARHEGALLVINKVKELSRNYPVIVTGDFNAVPTDDPIQVLTNSPEGYSLTDTRSVSPLVYGPNWSFHDFGRVKMAERSLIDYIFIKGNIKVMRYGVLTDMLNALYPSDHCPVLSTLIIH
jgi:endonuclease/exonuclease/phosphatase family metal-dependent hydrolase